MKRMATLFLAFLLVCMSMCPVSAASATITVGTVTANPGDTVTVPLSVSQIDGIGAVGIYVRYDTAVLECVSAEAVGIMNDMDTNTANTAPVNRTGEVWLTGMCLNGIAGSGALMQMTFKVKDNAPEGLSPIDFVADKPNQLILLNGSLLDAQSTAGGVAVTTTPKATVTTAAPVDTTTKAPTEAAATDPTSADVTTTEGSKATYTRPNGEPLTLNEVTMVDANGTVVTAPGGDPVMVQNVAVMVSEAAAAPGERVTVDVSMTAVSDLAVLGIDVSYDSEALKFVSGEMLGFVKEEMNAANVACNQEGVVVISCTDPMGVSGEGAVARLTFEVKRSAKAGDYRLALSPEPVLMSKTSAKLPMETHAGKITVEGGAASPTLWVFIALGVIAFGGATAAAVVAVRRKKASPASPDAQ